MFVVDKSQLKTTKVEETCNALYAAIYTEFMGAVENPTYKDKNNSEKLELINNYANNWLKSRGLI